MQSVKIGPLKTHKQGKVVADSACRSLSMPLEAPFGSAYKHASGLQLTVTQTGVVTRWPPNLLYTLLYTLQ
jgi:hypothetical protein